MKQTWALTLLTLALCTWMAHAQQPAPQPDRWTVTVGGVGWMDGRCSWDNFNYAAEVGLGYSIPLDIGKTTVATEAGIRQSVGENGSCWSVKGLAYRTEFFWDWNVPVWHKLSFYAGPAISSAYGDMITDWFIGPEAGLKWTFSEKWLAFFRANYDWNVTSEGNQVANSSDGFRLTTGVGFKF